MAMPTRLVIPSMFYFTSRKEYLLYCGIRGQPLRRTLFMAFRLLAGPNTMSLVCIPGRAGTPILRGQGFCGGMFQRAHAQVLSCHRTGVLSMKGKQITR